MHTLVTGGTGFIGTLLVRSLINDGQHCTVISRSGTDRWNTDAVTIVTADPTTPGVWQNHIAQVDTVVNLAGARIVDPPLRWTRRRKAILRSSRVATTTNLAEAIRSAARPPGTFLSSSAIGYYGARGDDIIDETAPPGRDFLGSLAVEWEQATQPATEATRIVVMRTGLPLSPTGGILEALLPIFRTGLGGPFGDPANWLSWIHWSDTIRLVRFLMTADVTGPVNITAPNPVTVKTFAKALGEALHRPAFIPAPALGLRLALGESADALLHLQRVVPARVLDAGFEFEFPTIALALEDLFGK